MDWTGGTAESPRLLHLMDREGDVYEVRQWVEEVEDSAIIRCVQNRREEAPLRLAQSPGRAPTALGSGSAPVPWPRGKPARPPAGGVRGVASAGAAGSSEIHP